MSQDIKKRKRDAFDIIYGQKRTKIEELQLCDDIIRKFLALLPIDLLKRCVMVSRAFQSNVQFVLAHQTELYTSDIEKITVEELDKLIGAMPRLNRLVVDRGFHRFEIVQCLSRLNPQQTRVAFRTNLDYGVGEMEFVARNTHMFCELPVIDQIGLGAYAMCRLFQDAPQLQTLSLRNRTITLLGSPSNSIGLRRLRLKKTKFVCDDTHPNPLWSQEPPRELEHLSLDTVSGLGNFWDFIKPLQKLQTLRLKYIEELTDAILLECIPTEALTDVLLVRCDNITEQALATFLTRCHALKTLRLVPSRSDNYNKCKRAAKWIPCLRDQVVATTPNQKTAIFCELQHLSFFADNSRTKAIEAIEARLIEYPDDAAMLATIGTIQRHLYIGESSLHRSGKDAIQSFIRVLKLNPGDVNAQFSLACLMIYHSTYSIETIKRHLSTLWKSSEEALRVVELLPHKILFLRRKGVKRMIKVLVAIFPQDKHILWYRLAEIFASKGSKAKAALYLLKAQKLAPTKVKYQDADFILSA